MAISGMEDGTARGAPGRSMLIAWIMMALAMLGWATNMVIGKLGAVTIHPYTLSFWRLALGAVVLGLLARNHIARDLPRLLAHWKPVLLLSAFGFFGTNLFNYIGLSYTTALNGLLLNSVSPVVVFALSMVFFGERASKRQLLGLVVSLMGVAAIILRGDIGALRHLQINIGDPIVFLSILSYCGYATFMKLRPDVHPFSFMLGCYVPALLMFIPLFIVDLAHGQDFILDWKGIAIVWWLALVPGILSYLSFNAAIKHLGANRAGLATHMMPAFGAVLSMLILSEQPHWYHLTGVVLIFAGLGLSQLRTAKGGKSASVTQ